MVVSITTNGLVFVTGATGHVGFRTLIRALRAGLNVRVAVRSHNKATRLLKRLLLKIPDLHLHKAPIFEPASNFPPQRLSFAIIPDVTVDGAFDDVLEGVTQVIHIASPLVTGKEKPPIESRLADDFFIRPAVQGTISLLEAANACGTVRRVVVTSSIVALIPVPEMEGTRTRPANKPVRPTDRVPFTSGPYHSEFAAYANSKIAALNAAEAWFQEKRPAFDIVHLHPSFVLGRNDMATTPTECMKGTNAMVLAMLLGKCFGPFAGATVHVDDVARCHVAAVVDAKGVPGNASYLLSQSSTWNDAKGIAGRLFPQATKCKLLVGDGDVGTTAIQIDTALTQDTFGIRFRRFDDQVKSLVSQFLELRSKGRQAGTEHRPPRDKSLKKRETGITISQREILL